MKPAPRIYDDRRLPWLKRGAQLKLLFDGEQLTAYEGETVAAALLAAGVRKARVTANGEARGPYCGIGVCFDCLMEIDGLASVRACQTQVHEGMDVRTQAGFGAAPGSGDGE